MQGIPEKSVEWYAQFFGADPEVLRRESARSSDGDGDLRRGKHLPLAHTTLDEE